MNAHARMDKYLKLLLAGAILALSAGSANAAPALAESGHDESPAFTMVQERALELSSRPYQKNTPDLPSFLAALNYDQYRDIRFHPEQSLWLKERLPFQVQFFSRASMFTERVLVSIIDQDKATSRPATVVAKAAATPGAMVARSGLPPVAASAAT